MGRLIVLIVFTFLEIITIGLLTPFAMAGSLLATLLAVCIIYLAVCDIVKLYFVLVIFINIYRMYR